MAAGSIVVDLLLKTGTFETDTQRASKALKQFQKDADAVGKAIGVAFVGAATGLGYLVKSSIDAEDHLNDLSKKTGIAADTLGGIGFAAQQSGGDIDSAAAATGKLNKSLAEAAAGNKEASEAFKVLGINVKDAAGNTKTADAALAEIADKFASYADGPEKAALALRIFGKAGADIIPLLDDGGAALQSNIDYYKRYSGVTADSAAAADQFNDTLTKLKLLSGAFGKALTAELLGPLQALADLWLSNKENGDQFRGAASGIVDALKAITLVAAYGAEQFLIYGKSIAAVGAAGAALKDGNFRGIKGAFDELLSDAAAGRKRLDDLKKAFESTGKAADSIDFGVGNGFDGPKKAAPRLPTTNPAAKDDFSGLYKQAIGLQAVGQAALDAGEDFQILTDAQKLGAKIAADYAAGLIHLTPAQLASLDATLKTADGIEKQVRAQQDAVKWLQEATDANATFLESQQHLRDSYEEQAKNAKIQADAFGLTTEEVDALATARLRDTAAALEQKAAVADADGFLDDVSKLYKDQAKAIRDAADARDFLSAKEHALHFDSLTGASAAVKDYLTEISKAGDNTYQIIHSAFQSLEDAGVSVLTGGSLKDAAKTMVNQILAEVYRLAVVRPLLNSIFGNGGAGGLGGLLSSFFGGSAGATGGTPGAGSGFQGTGGADFQLATGTNFVPYDGLKATLHKGEAVVPKAFNPMAGGRGLGGGDTFVNIKNNGQPVTAHEESRQQTDQGTIINLVLDAVASDIGKGGKVHKAISGQYGVSRAAGNPKRG